MIPAHAKKINITNRNDVIYNSYYDDCCKFIALLSHQIDTCSPILRIWQITHPYNRIVSEFYLIREINEILGIAKFDWKKEGF